MVALHLALLLSLGQFLPDGMQPVQPKSGTGPVSTATLSAPFATPGAYASPTSIPLGGPVTDTRASAATYQPTATTVATASNDQLRVDRFGELNDVASTNTALNSGAVGTGGGWVTINDSFTSGYATAPDGTMSMALLTPNSPGSGQAGVYQIVTVAGGTMFTGSMWVQGTVANQFAAVVTDCFAGTQGSCACATSDGTACIAYTPAANECGATVPLSTTVPRRLYVSGTCSTANTSMAIAVDSSSSGATSPNTGAILVWGAQMEGLPFGTSYIPTVGTAVARATETVTVPAVGAIGAVTGSGVLTYTPEWGSSTAGADRVILSTAGLVLKWVNASTTVSVTAGGATATSASLTWSANSSHTLRWRYGGGAGSGACIRVDAAAEVCSGTYSSITPTNPLYIGGDASGGGGAAIAGLKACPGNSACN